ncbi:hypothetical protein CAPTEDRAFT_92523 [Capitella teleta]|uniref:Protein ABHD13 n=1 Tax=Capitella teleta TaxID=283909 RepID=R7TLV8_CAPTE|nr:hypothetical protein CAPTEDRAFT_92523 [Capitella teleta]|eukprot:ELT92541.1 hypothetical protein CAPTEDRAFT_92523 [Capitella teleta]
MLRLVLIALRFLQLVLKKFWALSTALLLVLLLLHWMYGSLASLAMLLLGISGLLYNAQDLLLYRPEDPPQSRLYVESPATYGLLHENIFAQTKDGVSINMILIKQPSPLMGLAHTIVIFHGNAGNIGHRLPNCYALQTYLRANVVLVEYRGFGKSGGKPSEQGLYLDAACAMDYLLKRSDINPKKLVLFGRSLGGAVAIQAASRYAANVHALIVENTFTSLPDIGRHLFDFRVIRCLPKICFKNKYPSDQRISHLSVPSLFLSGSSDNLIPPIMMHKLYELSCSPLKRLAKFPAGTHNDTWMSPGYYETMNRFLVEVSAPVDCACIHVSPQVDSYSHKGASTSASYSVDLPFDDGGAAFSV